MAFRREKFVPRGAHRARRRARRRRDYGVLNRHNTLIHFRYNPEHKAQARRARHGLHCTGLDGRSITLQVPVGTSLYDMETGELVHDFQEPDEQLVIAKGAGAAAATSTLPPAPTRLRASTNWAEQVKSGPTAWN